VKLGKQRPQSIRSRRPHIKGKKWVVVKKGGGGTVGRGEKSRNGGDESKRVKKSERMGE